MPAISDYFLSKFMHVSFITLCNILIACNDVFRRHFANTLRTNRRFLEFKQECSLQCKEHDFLGFKIVKVHLSKERIVHIAPIIREINQCQRSG